MSIDLLPARLPARVAWIKGRIIGHSMRPTKVAQIYKKTGNLRAVQLLLGHVKMDRMVHYLGVDLEDALTLSEGIEL